MKLRAATYELVRLKDVEKRDREANHMPECEALHELAPRQGAPARGA